MPIIEKVVSDSSTLLGIRTTEFTIELYCEPDAVQGSGCASVDGLTQQFFYCPVSVDPCSPVIGVLVLTSMQKDAFAEDVLDTMQFVASLVSQYVAAHNRCFYEGWEYGGTAS